MNQSLQNDHQNIKRLLETAVYEASEFLDNLPNHPAAILPESRQLEATSSVALPDQGVRRGYSPQSI